MKLAITVAVVAAVLGMGSVPARASTLYDVSARGTLRCGVGESVAGFSQADGKGGWKGIDADLCRALAAAVLKDPTKVEYKTLTGEDALRALRAGEIDVLAGSATWTMSRDTAMGLNFAAVIYYDGQGFMVRRKLGITSALELSQATICVSSTVAELAVSEFFHSRKMPYEVMSYDTPENMIEAYKTERCGVMAANAAHLHAVRLQLAQPGEHMVLPEIISKEPLGPAVRKGDDQWFNLVKWVVFVLIDAEELGITMSNADDLKTSANPGVRQVLGVQGDMVGELGLDRDWAYRVIKAVGNYGEVFERNVGQASTLKIGRGLNALWNRGGILYAPPVR